MPSATLARYAFAEAKDKLSALTAQANETGSPFVVTKNGKPWVEVRPLATRRLRGDGVTITPVRHEVAIPDVGALLESYNGCFTPREDGFAAPAGTEEM